jgi:hypothetical protein
MKIVKISNRTGKTFIINLNYIPKNNSLYTYKKWR